MLPQKCEAVAPLQLADILHTIGRAARLVPARRYEALTAFTRARVLIEKHWGPKVSKLKVHELCYTLKCYFKLALSGALRSYRLPLL
jgi:hypothetical protein